MEQTDDSALRSFWYRYSITNNPSMTSEISWDTHLKYMQHTIQGKTGLIRDTRIIKKHSDNMLHILHLLLSKDNDTADQSLCIVNEINQQVSNIITLTTDHKNMISKSTKALGNNKLGMVIKTQLYLWLCLLFATSKNYYSYTYWLNELIKIQSIYGINPLFAEKGKTPKLVYEMYYSENTLGGNYQHRLAEEQFKKQREHMKTLKKEDAKEKQNDKQN